MCVPSVAAPVSGGIGSSVELLAALRVVEETYMFGEVSFMCRTQRLSFMCVQQCDKYL